MNANRGYVGWSKSVRAAAAEDDGKMPLTHAVREVAAYCKISQKAARELCKKIGPCEWHHTSKFFNETNYYDVGEITKQFDLAALARKLPDDWHARIDAAITAGGNDMDERHTRRGAGIYHH